MIKTASSLSLAILLFACGGGGQATKADPAGGAPAAEAETAPIPADQAAGEKAAEPVAGGATAQPAAVGDGDAMTDAEWEEAVVFSEKLADIVDANKDDCEQMAGALKPLFDESEALITKANKWQQTASEEEQKRFGEKYQDRLQAMRMKLGAGLQNCSNHAGVMEQFQRFQ